MTDSSYSISQITPQNVILQNLWFQSYYPENMFIAQYVMVNQLWDFRTIKYDLNLDFRTHVRWKLCLEYLNVKRCSDNIIYK